MAKWISYCRQPIVDVVGVIRWISQCVNFGRAVSSGIVPEIGGVAERVSDGRQTIN